jgi:hypothetical protein
MTRLFHWDTKGVKYFARGFMAKLLDIQAEATDSVPAGYSV